MADFSLNCSSRVNPQTGRSYDLTVELVFCPAFTQIFQDQAIENFQIASVVYNKNNPPTPLPGGIIFLNLGRVNGSLQQFHTFFESAPLPSDQQYRISVSRVTYNFPFHVFELTCFKLHELLVSSTILTQVQKNILW